MAATPGLWIAVPIMTALLGGPAHAPVARAGVALELEIQSTIQTTRVIWYVGPAGMSTVSGFIRLEQNPATHTWGGMGTLTSSTVPGPVGCETISISGSGTYDWVVRDAVVPLDVSTSHGGIEVFMDAGPINEAFDIAVSTRCPPGGSPIVTTASMSTWESFFFLGHRADFGPHGIAVRDWNVTALDGTWANGGLVAEKTWSETCGGTCSGSTKFHLYAVPR